MEVLVRRVRVGQKRICETLDLKELEISVASWARKDSCSAIVVAVVSVAGQCPAQALG